MQILAQIGELDNNYSENSEKRLFFLISRIILYIGFGKKEFLGVNFGIWGVTGG